MSIEKQQDMEVLGVDISPSMSIKDRTVVGTFVKIERMPHLAVRITRSNREAK